MHSRGKNNQIYLSMLSFDGGIYTIIGFGNLRHTPHYPRFCYPSAHGSPYLGLLSFDDKHFVLGVSIAGSIILDIGNQVKAFVVIISYDHQLRYSTSRLAAISTATSCLLQSAWRSRRISYSGLPANQRRGRGGYALREDIETNFNISVLYPA